MTNELFLNKKVLAVEDDSACRALFELILEGSGCKYEVATNGRDAVEKVRAGKFDLVLMDLRMPVMNGIEATRAIRQIDQNVPIIVLTAHAMAWEEGECQACGMNDYLIKPFNSQQLLDKIRQWMHD